MNENDVAAQLGTMQPSALDDDGNRFWIGMLLDNLTEPECVGLAAARRNVAEIWRTLPAELAEQIVREDYLQ